MKKVLLTVLATLLMASLTSLPAASAADYLLGPDEEVQEVIDELFTPEELDDLLAPIALYPDPLIAQVLPAATYIEQVDEAARYTRAYGRYARIDEQPWDVSVRAVAHYPDVLYMMDQKYDWTVALGQAYINQPEDVMESIQYLREEAREKGNLFSTPEQSVIIEDGLIRIIPAQPQVLYVPAYDPVVVYLERQPSYGFVTFGAGFSIGLWLNRDCDWHRHRIYYHGWKGGGWVDRARPHLPVRNSVYVNKRFATIDVNRRVVERSTTRYRQDMRRSVQHRRERPGQPPPWPRPTPPDRKAVPRGGQIRPGPAVVGPPKAAPPVTGTRPEAGSRPSVAPAPSTTPPPPSAPVSGRRSPDSSSAPDNYRGRDTRESRPAPSSGFGGYGSGREIKAYRERGLESRGSMKQNNRPAVERRSAPMQKTPPVQSTPPVPNPAASEGRKPASAPAVQPPARQDRQDRGGRGRGEQQR